MDFRLFFHFQGKCQRPSVDPLSDAHRPLPVPTGRYHPSAGDPRAAGFVPPGRPAPSPAGGCPPPSVSPPGRDGFGSGTIGTNRHTSAARWAPTPLTPPVSLFHVVGFKHYGYEITKATFSAESTESLAHVSWVLFFPASLFCVDFQGLWNSFVLLFSHHQGNSKGLRSLRTF